MLKMLLVDEKLLINKLIRILINNVFTTTEFVDIPRYKNTRKATFRQLYRIQACVDG